MNNPNWDTLKLEEAIVADNWLYVGVRTYGAKDTEYAIRLWTEMRSFALRNTTWSQQRLVDLDQVDWEYLALKVR